jgi:hypothetical protein
MKKIFMLMAFVTLIVGCQVEEINEESIESENLSIENNKNKLPMNGSFNNEIVVQYNTSLSEAEKQTMRAFNNVTSFKKCECADPTLELWEFEIDKNGYLPGGVHIEEVVLGNKDTSGLEGIEFNNSIEHMGEKLAVAFGSADVSVGLTKQVASNNDLTIAILDTGVDYNYFGFTQPFLFNTTVSSTSCTDNGYEDYIGWDFVNQDNDPFDDFGHGTVISSLIYEKLIGENINFQILPIKVFDQSGKGKYFDILCGYKYATNNPEVDMINMSFGWYNNSNTEILDRFIQESQEKVLLTTSAGNAEQDNDVTPHYPSSYSVNNLLAVASLSSHPSEIRLAHFSNFGSNSVDIAAIGQDIPFQIAPGEYMYVNGTSYSSAYTAAYAGTLFQQENTPQKWISNILETTTYGSNLSMLKYQSYID